MSKINNKEKKEIKKDNKLEWPEVRESLVTQRQDALKKIDDYTKLALKAEGAIEVGDQMYNEEGK